MMWYLSSLSRPAPRHTEGQRKREKREKPVPHRRFHVGLGLVGVGEEAVGFRVLEAPEVLFLGHGKGGDRIAAQVSAREVVDAVAVLAEGVGNDWGREGGGEAS